MTGNWHEIERYLLAALTLAPAERQVYLERACVGQPTLRQVIESFLASEREMGSFLEASPDAIADDGSTGDMPQLAAGQQLGPYRILRKIGQGGMSIVYLARREDLQRQVAIKVIKRGMDSVEILRRFSNERQILANLNHPSIAQLYDGGTTEDGLSFFVMEHVPGLPIDEFCDRHRLRIADRIELFRRVCAAVHYAHQNLVVHRDIKPGNILVTDDGTPKLLDFGIAKLLKPPSPSRVAEPTVAWMRLMTPSYASPEQVRGQAITTACDVYSLGVLLYKLLTDQLPYRFETGLPKEMDHVFTNTRPVKPSVAVARLLDPEETSTGRALDPQQLSEARQTLPAKLVKNLRGDLDRIALMALRVQPQRRYGSVEQLSEDLRRSQLGLPIAAREDSFIYRTKTFLRRNKLAVVTALVVACLILGFAALAVVSAVRVERERQQTEQVAEFLIALFDTSGAGSARSDTITARELLERGAARVDRHLEEQPRTRATLIDTIGRAYANLRLADRAVPFFEEALRLRRSELGEDHPLVAMSLDHLADALRDSGDYQASELHFKQALALWRHLDMSSPEVASTLSGFADLRLSQGDLRGAARFAREAVEIQRVALGEHDAKTAQSKASLALCLRDLGEYREADQLYKEAITALRQPSAEPASLARALNGRGFLLANLGDLTTAEPLIREALEMRRQLFGEDHPIFAESLSVLSFLLMEQGAYKEVVPLMRKTLEILRDRHGPEHPAIARQQYNLALALGEMQLFDESERVFRQTVVLASKLVDEDHPRLANIRAGLAAVLHAQGKLDEAELLFRRAASSLSKSVGEQHIFMAHLRIGLGSVLCDTGDFTVGVTALRQAIDVIESRYGEGYWRTVQAKVELGGCLIGLGRTAEAEVLLRAIYPLLTTLESSHPNVVDRARKHSRKLPANQF